MNRIGIRVEPKFIHYAIVALTEKEDSFDIVDVSHVVVPQGLLMPDRLRYLRSVFSDLFQHYQIGYAGIRLAETIAQQRSRDRIYYEAILTELIADSKLLAYFAGTKTSICSKLGIKTKEFKAAVDSHSYLNIPDWSSYKPNGKEALLTALVTLQLSIK